jgi:hypothetical protein
VQRKRCCRIVSRKAKSNNVQNCDVRIAIGGAGVVVALFIETRTNCTNKINLLRKKKYCTIKIESREGG